MSAIIPARYGALPAAALEIALVQDETSWRAQTSAASKAERRPTQRLFRPVLLPESKRRRAEAVADKEFSFKFANVKTRSLHERAWTAVATMRWPDAESELTNVRNALLTRLTACNYNAVAKAIEICLSRIGRMDALFDGTHFGLLCLVEAASCRKRPDLLEDTAFTATGLLRAALPHLRSKTVRLSMDLTAGVGILTLPRLPLDCAHKFGGAEFAKAFAAELDFQDVVLEFISRETSPSSDVAMHTQGASRLRTTIVSSAAPARAQPA